MRVNPILMILVSFYSPDTELKSGTSLFVQSVHPADISDFEKSQFFDFFSRHPSSKTSISHRQAPIQIIPFAFCSPDMELELDEAVLSETTPRPRSDTLKNRYFHFLDFFRERPTMFDHKTQ